MVRVSVVAAAMLFSHPSAVIVPSTSDVVIDPTALVQVICVKGTDEYAGTAFRVGNGVLLSVNHVTESGRCTINGAPISKWYKSPNSDFSMLHGDSGAAIKVDCGGFVKGHHYVAVGYGRGLQTLTEVDLVAIGQNDPRNGQALLSGVFAVVPGQSGGAILDEDTGKAVGMVNAEDYEDGISWSVALRDTPICEGKAA